MTEQIVALREVGNGENHTLILLAIVDGEVEPETKTWIACVGSKAQVVLVIVGENDIAEIACLECCIEAEVTCEFKLKFYDTQI